MKLASETFKVLETCINISDPHDSLSSSASSPSNPKRSYREALRAHMNYELVSRLIALGRGAHQFLKMVRATDLLGRVQLPVSEFERNERTLWYERLPGAERLFETIPSN
jgi:hypothetical protein